MYIEWIQFAREMSDLVSCAGGISCSDGTFTADGTFDSWHLKHLTITIMFHSLQQKQR